jgi:aminoglycoside/choline kinase family phosphotransferase
MLSPCPDRSLEIAAFLEAAGWGHADLQPFAGDFSTRRYERLGKADGQTAILMDAGPEDKTPAFVALARLLAGMGLRAPHVYAANPAHGLVLMEDFGNRRIGALIDGGADPQPLLQRAAAVLAGLHRAFMRDPAFVPELPVFDSRLFIEQAGLFLDHYVPFAHGREANEAERVEFDAAWRVALRGAEALPQSLILRDFMPDNLMDLPDGAVGLLDFQDAGIGPVAYDLASLCEVVRRDGMYAYLPAVLDAYRAAADTNLSQADLTRACAVLSAQRHTRILGILARLSQQGRADKAALIPRVKAHVAHLLAHEPALMPVRQVIEALLDAPGRL